MGKTFDRMGGMVRRGGDGLLRLALPPVCPVTGDRVLEYGTLSPQAWTELTFITRPHCPVTGLPFERDPGDGTVSPAALASPPRYDHARSALLFEGRTRQLVHLLKYADRTELTLMLGRWMAHAGRDLLADADMLAPVPLHAARLVRRRFNQAALLGQALHRLTGVPLEVALLDRVKATRSQVGLSRSARRRNVQGAFGIAPGRRVAGKHIVLVDDVLTSGATAEACAAVLRRAGAARVDVLTLARVVAPQDVPI
ncbi:ComF family protein [Pyruvatibacter mobilis]|jgi:ComF family protein|uniref:ComF family protein n=1 Tax=Pyruvatibacter mobilis TaxID=1712261 RepID=UPI003BAD494F